MVYSVAEFHAMLPFFHLKSARNKANFINDIEFTIFTKKNFKHI